MKRMLAFLLCLLMLLTATACSNNADHDHDHDHEATTSTVQTTPQAKDATGSAFIGDWSVSAQLSPLNRLSFFENGTLHASFDGSSLGGVFYDNGTTLTLLISQKTIEGTYTVDGNTITVTTADDVLVLTKIL